MEIDSSKHSFVTIVIPFRDEEKFIAKCIDSVLENDYPRESMEIILVDGLSTDNSVNIINDYIKKHSFIKVIENKNKIFPCAVNIGYKASKGDYLIILGAHAVYEKDYISKCIETSLQYSADNAGGVLTTVGLNEDFIGKSISYVLSSSFGVGNSTFRTGCDTVKEVDTVFGGCYKRSVFEKIGLFNEDLVSSSDMDFNVRLRKNGGKIILSPSIKATYYTRTSFKKFLKNNFRNGFWAVYPMRFVDYIPVKLRHFVPLLFLLGLLGGTLISLVLPLFCFLLTGAIFLYFLTAYIFSMKFMSNGFLYFLFLPFLFFILHVTYGVGSFVALVKVAGYKFFS
ncbi:MAG: glycosyltransferase family 2 protein [Bacteroidales bacterium]|nr:glycosyltransferase family 2 protein [Bacteroidales bacterium]